MKPIIYKSKFEGINLELSSIPRTTIFLGENMVGKSTVLDMMVDLLEVAEYSASQFKTSFAPWIFDREPAEEGKLKEIFERNISRRKSKEIMLSSQIFKIIKPKIETEINNSLSGGRKIKIEFNKKIVSDIVNGQLKYKESDGIKYWYITIKINDFERKIFSEKDLVNVFCNYYMKKIFGLSDTTTARRRINLFKTLHLGPNRITETAFGATNQMYRIAVKSNVKTRRPSSLGIVDINDNKQRKEVGFKKVGDEKHLAFRELSSGFQSLSILEMASKIAPDHLLIDEPEAHLSSKNITRLVRSFKRYQNYSKTNLFIATHSEDFVRQIHSEYKSDVQIYILKRKNGVTTVEEGEEHADEYFEEENRRFIY